MSASIKPGYKQTEIGVIPEDWDAMPACRIGTFRGGNGFPLTAQGERNGAYPFFKVSDMNNEGNETFMTTANHRISEETRKRLGATAFPEDSIVFAKVGAAIFLERKKILGQASCIDNNMAALVLDKSRSDVRFVHSQLLRKRLGALVATTALPSLNGKQLGEIILAVPPLPEQRGIAEALSDVDGLLGALDRLIAKKRDLKQAAMQQLLTAQTRLPGFSAEWEVKRLGECLLSRPDYGINAAAVPFSDKLPSYIRITDISEHGRFCSGPRVSVKAPNADQYYLHEGDVVFARTGASVGKSYLYDPRDGRLVFAGFLIRVRPNPELLIAAFLTAYTTTKPYWNWVRLMSMRSGQPGINGNEYAQLPLPIPPITEQTAIAEVLRAMDVELAALEQRREKTSALKHAMMQELLTGRTRLV